MSKNYVVRSEEFQEIYPAKLLLFGEYTVLSGGSALALPTEKFHAEWVSAGKGSELDRRFVKLIEPLLRMELSCEKDTAQWTADRAEGLVLKSTIPFGKGLGSSGSLCAAIYHRYYQNNRRAKRNEIHQDLVEMENFFHGQSSGMDPLCVFWRLPVLQDEKGLRRWESPLIWGEWQVFLLDSKKERSTRELVNVYRQKLRNSKFVAGVEQVSDSTEACIKWLLKGEPLVLGKYLRRLSEQQLKYWPFLIPDSIEDLWKKGLTTGDYFMKLCGAGGGGFFIGFARKGVSLPEGAVSVHRDALSVHPA